MATLNESEYLEACEEYNGYCTHCDEITNIGGVEPDAENYTCEQCEHDTVMGVENALLEGHITLK